MIVAGCGTFGSLGTTATPEPAEEHMPSPAAMHVSGDPAIASGHILIRLLTGDPGWSREAAFEAGQTIDADFAVSEGDYRLVSELPECSSVITLGPDTETDVVMHILDAGLCSFEVVGAHISRFKRWLVGTYDKPPTDLARYLGEFCFRSEFRKDPDTAF